METSINLSEHLNTDLNMYTCGFEDCLPEHCWGPGVRDHYLIHFVKKGQGVFKVNEQEYQIKKNQGFLICPEYISFYQADKNDPWHYYWIGFNGLKADKYLQQLGLSVNKPVFALQSDSFDKVFQKMISIKKATQVSELKLTAYLYYFLAELMTEIPGNEQNKLSNKANTYVQRALEYLKKNYYRQISITELATILGLDRSYFYTLFKDELHCSPQNYLINLRISKAVDLMGNKELTISNIAHSVGYQDQLYFSKLFKKRKGLAPREYRKGIVERDE